MKTRIIVALSILLSILISNISANKSEANKIRITFYYVDTAKVDSIKEVFKYETRFDQKIDFRINKNIEYSIYDHRMNKSVRQSLEAGFHLNGVVKGTNIDSVSPKIYVECFDKIYRFRKKLKYSEISTPSSWEWIGKLIYPKHLLVKIDKM